MALVIETRNAHGAVSRTRLRPGSTRLTVKPGDVFRLVDEATGKAPPKAVVKQLDNSILIDNLDDAGSKSAPSSVELIGFYSTCSISAPCHLQLPDASGSGVVDITPSTAAIGALSDGSFVLHDPTTAGSAAVVGTAAPAAPAEETVAGLSRPVIYGIGGAAVIGVAAAAGGGGGGGGGGDTNVSNAGDAGGTTTPAPAPAPAPIDTTLKVTHSSVGKAGKPVLAGTGTPGSTITINVDTNSDKTQDIVYQTTVGADGKWSANLATLKPTTGTLPAAGVTTAASIEVSQNTGGQTSTLPAVKLTADDTAPAAPSLDPVTADNIINAAELGKPIALSGQGEADSLIRVNLGTQAFEGTVGADGKWQVELPGTAIAATATSVALSVVNLDHAGNASTATTRTVAVDSKPPAAPLIQATGGIDNYVNAAEKAAGTTITGTAEANSTVKITIGTFTQTVKADATGKWSLALAGADLPAAEGKHDVTATATDAAGNESAPSAAAPMTVDTVAPELSAIKVGANGAARSGQPFLVSGESEAGSTVIVDYYPSNISNAFLSQNLLVPGTEGSKAAWTTAQAFVAPRTALTQEMRLVLSSTDKAGNKTLVEHKFTVTGHATPLGEIPEYNPETSQDPSPTLRPADLLDEGSSLAAGSSVLAALPGATSPILSSPAASTNTSSSATSTSGTEASGNGSTATTSAATTTTTTSDASSPQPSATTKALTGTATTLAALLSPDEQQHLALLS